MRGESRRAATRYVRSGAIINFRRCRRSSTSTSREKNHASAAGAGPTGVWSKSERSVVGQAQQRGTGTSRIENGSSSERTLHQNESRTSKMGKQRPLSRSRFSRLEHRQHSGLHHIGVESSGIRTGRTARKRPGLCWSEMAMRTKDLFTPASRRRRAAAATAAAASAASGAAAARRECHRMAVAACRRARSTAPQRARRRRERRGPAAAAPPTRRPAAARWGRWS